MSLVVVIAVTVVIIVYVRMMRRARQTWLTKLDLPGRWQARLPAENETDPGEQVELLLQGALDRGEFVLHEGQRVWRGEWQLVGHELTLRGEGRERAWDLHFFKPGSIGLENSTGVRRVYTKATTNVVPLRSKSGPGSRQQH